MYLILVLKKKTENHYQPHMLTRYHYYRGYRYRYISRYDAMSESRKGLANKIVGIQYDDGEGTGVYSDIGV